MIDEVQVKKLQVIPDERGRLMEILRCDDPMFQKFGQVYISVTYFGVIKGWHYHKIQEDNVAVVKGMLKLVLYDAREESKTKGEVNEFFIGEHNRLLVHIPIGVYHGWKCISPDEAIVINCSSEVYNYEKSDEYRIPFNSDQVPYDWSIRLE
jgi:dTDP-4-dehydrorhamnose 3,5-epimerase